MNKVTDPFASTLVPHAWESLHDALADTAPELLALLTKGPGKTEQDIAEQSLGYNLPKSVRAYFYFLTPKDDNKWLYLFQPHPQMHGSIYAPLSLAQALEERRVMLEIRDSLSSEERAILPADNGIFHGDWFHPSWLPIARDGNGNFLVAELDPPPGGRAGQIVEMNHDADEYFLLAIDLSELLETAAHDILTGELAEVFEDAEEDTLPEPPPPLMAEETALGSLPLPPSSQIDKTPDGTELLGGKQVDDSNSRAILLAEIDSHANLLLETAETMPGIIHQDQFAGISVRILQTHDKRYVAFLAGPNILVNNWLIPLRDAFFPAKDLSELSFSSNLGEEPLELGEIALWCHVA